MAGKQTVVVSTRVTPVERQLIAAVAASLGVTVADLLKDVAIERVRQQMPHLAGQVADGR